MEFNSNIIDIMVNECYPRDFTFSTSYLYKVHVLILFLATYIHYIRVDHTPPQIMFVGMLIRL